MNKSEQINELAAALAKAQAEIKNPEFDAENTFFRKGDGTASRYASLAGVRDAVTPALSKNGIAVMQDLRFDPTSSTVECFTMLLHASGQWIEAGPFRAPAVPGTAKDGRILPLNAQNVASASTYLRRYSLQATVNVVGDHDDDSEAGVGRGGAEAPAGNYGALPSRKNLQASKRLLSDPIGPPGEIPDHSAASPSGATADPAAGKAASLAQGFLNNLAAASTLAQVEGTVKGIVLIAGKLTDEEKASLRDAAAAARLRVAATSPKLVDVPNLLRELVALKQQLGDGLFGTYLAKHGGEDRAGFGLSAEKLVLLRDDCIKAT